MCNICIRKTDMETPNPKCPRCKCYWKPDETDIKSSGLYCKTCKKCRDYKRPKTLETYHKHKDYYDTKSKKYKEENRDKILANNREKITCECGVEITRNGKAKHTRTEKHLKRIEKNVVC